ncbi:MAG: MerR family transcriptional regulator [Planctomycetaceae bacterium]|nr:MerR family transcriptional regulator [Planctomycetaceae bacterium]
MNELFSIGEFSKITGLTVKALRFYHERELLVPARVEAGSGYRYYDHDNVQAARAIVALRELGFSVAELADILADHQDEADIVEFLRRRKQQLAEQIETDRQLVANLDRIIQQETEAKALMSTPQFEVEEKQLPALLVAGIRMRGRYDECGPVFGKLCRALGRHIAGKCMCLYYDGEYREDDADFEPCVPVKRAVEMEGVAVRELPAGRCVSLVHRGPYQQLGRSYERLLQYVKQRGYQMQLPTREVYLKGPGMIFRGNPKKYLTEIQIPIEDS